MSDVLTWSRKTPSIRGYYWYRDAPAHVPVIRSVDGSGSVGNGLAWLGFAINFIGEWAGPLVPPSGEAESSQKDSDEQFDV